MPLADVVRERIDLFLDAGSTGQLVLHVKEGKVMQLEANTITKIKEPAFDGLKDGVVA